MRNNRRRRARRGSIRHAAIMYVAVLAAVSTLGVAGIGVLREDRHSAPSADVFSLPVAAPTENATQTESTASVETLAAEARESEAAAEYLPVYRRADTDQKRIAITVDDCFQVKNLETIIGAARSAVGRITIFPIGQNLEKPGMARLLRYAAFELGDEIENHTWSHQRIFRLSEREMAAEIWKQSQAVNRALGVNYQQHFFRLMGGDGESDLRTHNYLSQLGFKGIASWSLSGSDADMDQIKRALRPGAVYLFHTTDADTAKLKTFIPYAVSQGYELVTLNELFGMEKNAVSEYAEAAMPEPRAYQEDYRAHREGDYAWNVVGMQDALRKMGYLTMSGPSTGYYGSMTAEAVRCFQRACGMPCTGIADEQTQRRLLGR